MTSSAVSSRIAVLAFEGVSDFHLSVPSLVFGQDRRDLGLPLFDVRICAVQAGGVRTQAGLEVQVRHGLEAVAQADMVFVPSWDPSSGPASPLLLDALRASHQRGGKLIGLCLGAFLLAETGLLAERRATTHWRWTSVFAQRFPQVVLKPDVLYVDHGDVLTSAGTVAGLDCCLHLLRTLVGAELANRLARVLVTPPHRQGNQAQFVERPMVRRPGDDRLGSTLDWALAHLQQRLDVDTLAAHAAMSRRTFTRHFRLATGCTVVQWVTAQRLAVVQHLLETSRMSMEAIAEQTGFGTALSMRQQFFQCFNTTPAQYRREFRGVEAVG